MRRSTLHSLRTVAVAAATLAVLLPPSMALAQDPDPGPPVPRPDGFPWNVTLSGSLRSAESGPLAGVRLHATLIREIDLADPNAQWMALNHVRVEVLTDEDGRFAFTVPAGPLPGYRFTLRLEDAARPAKWFYVERFGDEAPRSQDLGPLVVDDPPVVAVGQVIAAPGEELDSESVRVILSTPTILPGTNRIEPLPDPSLTHRIDPDGRLTILGWPRPGPLQVTVGHQGHGFLWAPPVEVPPMAKGLRLQLPDTGHVETTVLLPEGALSGMAELTMRHVSTGTQTRIDVVQGRDGHARTRLLTGRFELGVHVFRRSESLLALGSFELHPGETVHPDPIDLREHLQVIELSFVGDERRLSEIEVYQDGALGAVRSRREDRGRLRLTVARPADLWVCATGCASVRVTGTRSQVEVRLRPAPSVELRLRLPPDCEPFPAKLWLVPEDQISHPPRPWIRMGRRLDGDSVRLDAPVPGRYRIGITALNGQGARNPALELEARVDVEEDGPPVTVPITASEYETLRPGR